MADLHAVRDAWDPDPVETTGAVGAWAVGAFCGLLDLPASDPLVAGDGEELPPLWHWLGFAGHPRQAELGDDGHERDGPFLPPVPHRRRMYAGGRVEVHAPIAVGETLRRRSRLARSVVKDGRSGPMLLATVRHELTRDGVLLVAEEQDHAYRSQEPGSERGIAFDPPDDDPPPPGPLAVALDASETLLFRFSALTYNTHRIHYDHPYATGVEGYPGLVVHGPLLALLACEIPRRHHAERPVARVDYRLRRPAFARTRVVADVVAADAGSVDGPREGGSDDDGSDGSLSVAVGVPGAPPSLTATVTLDPPR